MVAKGSAVAIRAAAWHLPDRVVGVADLPELATLPPDERAACLALGIDKVRADDELSSVDLAALAAQRVLGEVGLLPLDVGALIVVDSRVPDTLLSAEATRLQALLDVRRAVTFSVGGLGCASASPALTVARGLLAADEGMDNVLVVHGSKPATPTRYRHPVTISGDGGLAMILSRHGPVRVLDIVQETSGEYWDLFQIEYRDRPSAAWREECRDLPTYTFRLAMETRDRLATLLDRILRRNGLRREDVACVLGQNLSVAALRFAEECLGAPMAPACLANLRQYGHLGPNDAILNLYTEIACGRLRSGQRALLLGLSPVAAWSLMLVAVGDRGGQTYHL